MSSYLVCCLCRNRDASFPSLNKLEEHLVAHHFENNCFYDCNLCPKERAPGFLTDIALQYHIKLVHNGQQDKLDENVTLVKLEIDQRLNASIDAAFAGPRCLCCPTCLEQDDTMAIVYGSLLQLEEHIAGIHYKKFHTCSARLCSARFYTKYAMLLHFKSDHEDQNDEIAVKFRIYESLNNSVKMSLEAISPEPGCSRGVKREHIDDSRHEMVVNGAVATNLGLPFGNNLNSESLQVNVKSEQTPQNTVPFQPANEIIESDGNYDQQTTEEGEQEQTSTGSALAAALPDSEPEQKLTEGAADQFSQNDLPNLNGQPDFTNNQSAPLGVFNPETDVSEESAERQEVPLDVDINHRNSASEPSVVPQEPVQAKESSLKLRLRNQKRPYYGDRGIGTSRDRNVKKQRGLVKNNTRARNHMEERHDESVKNDVQSNSCEILIRQFRMVKTSYICRLCEFTSSVPVILTQHIGAKHKEVSKLYTATSRNNSERNMRKKPGKKH
ncbi:hypothetical protein DdX_08916 [Ditylenchus destructor]|uniref:C2H2-type domain-containing protein n=1 Tax=Ditylenchus destructor TaxID=166010 RepID=A0AAD4N600_9BILA|nr:hypothetical protein DdX_08916 [Ditylenchus destructor]